jgi:hypothetical protein
MIMPTPTTQRHYTDLYPEGTITYDRLIRDGETWWSWAVDDRRPCPQRNSSAATSGSERSIDAMRVATCVLDVEGVRPTSTIAR